MRCAKRVVLAFAALREPRNAAALAERVHAVAAACKNFVRVALMANIPDQPVMGRVKNIVQRHGQLDDAKRRAEMAAGFGDAFNGVPAEFVRESYQIRFRHLAEISRVANAIQQWRRATGH